MALRGIGLYAMPKVLIYPTQLGREHPEQKERFVPLSINLSGSVFGNGSASATVIDMGEDFVKTGQIITPGSSRSPLQNYYGGRWNIDIGDTYKYQFLLTSADSTRLLGGRRVDLSFDDLKNSWALLKTNEIYSSYSTYEALVNALITEVTHISGNDPAQCPDTISISSHPALSLFCTDGIYKIDNSTFLNEIMKLLQMAGFCLFAEPNSGDLRIVSITPLTTVFATHTINANTAPLGLMIKDAKFSLNYMGIPTAVIVTDGNSPRTFTYGRYVGTGGVAGVGGSLIDNRNYDISNRNQPSYAVVYGLSNAQMQATAESIYTLGAAGERVLQVTMAGIPFSPILWTNLVWTDDQENTGTWLVTDFSIDIQPNALHTTITAFKVG